MENLKLGTNEMRNEVRKFADNLISEINKYCNVKGNCVTDKARKLLNIEAKKVLKTVNSDNIPFLELTIITQALFDKFESFAEENQKMLQLVGIIDDTCLEDLDNEIHQFLLANIIEQSQMRILTGMEYQKYLVSKVKKIKEM